MKRGIIQRTSLHQWSFVNRGVCLKGEPMIVTDALICAGRWRGREYRTDSCRKVLGDYARKEVHRTRAARAIVI